MSRAVCIEDLSFGYGAAPVLGLDRLEIEAGERVFLYGPSGSGKSTLLGLIAGVLAPQKGRVQVLGHELGTMRQRARDAFRAEHLGVIFQTFNLLPFLNVADNIRLGCAFSDARLKRATEAGMEDSIARLLERLGLEADLATRPVPHLSVGQQQRVAVARALIGTPDLVIADEPTSALDTATRDLFLDLLTGLCSEAGSTLVFVSHDLSLGSRFDRKLDLAALNHAGRAAA